MILLILTWLIFLSAPATTEPVDEACSTVHGAGSCCRIEVSETYGGGVPIERIVCGNS